MGRLLITTLLVMTAVMAHALDVPLLRAHINDYASILSPETVQKLERQLADFEKSDSTQIVVLTIPGLQGDALEDFSIKVAESWKVGYKGKDNGVILLIARDDRKLRIEVGRGLEGKLTDLMSGRIIRYEITPRFKAGDFNGGVEAGVAAIMALVRGEYAAAPSDTREAKKSSGLAFTLLIFLFFITLTLGGIAKILGGVSGGVGLPIVSALAFPGMALAALGGIAVGGFVLGLLLSWMFGGRGGRGGGAPFLGGGGFSGGGFSGGGFSGGGGSFGGGGSSGSW
jgi:uncharacterized protein